MSVRATVVTFAVVAVLGVAALLAAAAADRRFSAFSLDVGPDGPIASLSPGQRVCQGPFEAAVGFGSVTAWISANGNVGASIQMRVLSAAGATLATGQIPKGYAGLGARTFELDRAVASGRRITVCLRSTGPEAVSLFGAGTTTAIQFAHVGRLAPAGLEGATLALVFTRRHPRSLLSLFPTIFRRAAVFRPSFVGAWTYWLLVAGVLAAFVLGGLAVARAVRSDAESDSQS
jgi:hypothetical protein